MWEMPCHVTHHTNYAGFHPKLFRVCCFVLLYLQTSADAGYLARHVGLKCGVPVSTPALTVNRLCGSGFQSVVNAAQVCVRWTVVSLFSVFMFESSLVLPPRPLALKRKDFVIL